MHKFDGRCEMMKRIQFVMLVATLLFSMAVVLTSPVLAVTNDELDNYDPSYEDPVDTGEDMDGPAWYGTIIADTGEVKSGCKVELFKEKWSPQGWWKIGEHTTDSSGAYQIVLHKSMILKGHYVMRISDGSTYEIYGRDIGDSQSGDWGYGVPIEEMWNCPWSQTTDGRTMLTKFVNRIVAFFIGGQISETSATGETPPLDSKTTDSHTMLTKAVNRIAVLFTSETSRISVTDEISFTRSPGPDEIPEFTTLAIPVVALLGLFVFYRRKQNK